MMIDFMDWILLDHPIIPEKTATRIADQLDVLISTGQVTNAEKKFIEEIGRVRYRKCYLCSGQASLLPGPQCKNCHGTGVVDIFGRGCPLNVEGIQKFSGFCRDSGGYWILHRNKSCI
jgi:DnaJ-class molecular chaperone